MTPLLPLALLACAGPPTNMERVATGAMSLPPHPVSVRKPPDPRPLPIWGGGLVASVDRPIAWSADVAGGVVRMLDLEARTTAIELDLGHTSRPFRLALVPESSTLLVTLRGTGEVAAVGPAGELVARTWICPEPRGVAWNPYRERVLAACASGELVSLSPALEVLDVHQLDADLRDVVVTADGVHVSRFKSAELLSLTHELELVQRQHPPLYAAGPDWPGEDFAFEPGVAWRLRTRGDGAIVMLHQRGSLRPLSEALGSDQVTGLPVYYGTPPELRRPHDTAVHPALTVFPPGAEPSTSVALQTAGIAVDFAGQGAGYVLATPSTGVVSFRHREIFDTDVFPTIELSSLTPYDLPAGTVAVATDANGQLLWQRQAPYSAYAELPEGESANLRLAASITPREPSFDLFHQDAGFGVACASCHPEGREDGRVWDFGELGLRRTQDVSALTARSAPFHWDGSLANMTRLLEDVFVRRMGGTLSSGRTIVAADLEAWLVGLRPLRPEDGDPELVEAGAPLFATRCFGCHGAPAITAGLAADVGTGGTLQVPPLAGIAGRAPYLHDGCATTLEERFDARCGGGQHGDEGLGADEIAALVAYLRTL